MLSNREKNALPWIRTGLIGCYKKILVVFNGVIYELSKKYYENGAEVSHG
jgi:hypothetical protein